MQLATAIIAAVPAVVAALLGFQNRKVLSQQGVPTNGKTVAEMVEQTAESVGAISVKLDAHIEEGSRHS